jgi:G3E family GTPase
MRIPLYLVTGFLGSGKTSFLKHFLKENSLHGKVAVIQNEFSSVNMDGKDIQQQGDYQILEINNGSVFCVCLLGSFIKSLAVFIEEARPDSLIMEASGMSDPVSLGQILQAASLKEKVYLSHVWSVVDALNFSRSIGLRNRILHQLRIADTIIINKMDLAGEKAVMVMAEVKKMNPFAQVIPATYAQVDVHGLRKALNLFPAGLGEEQQSTRPDLESVVIKTGMEISPEKLESFTGRIREQSIRCKGYVRITGGKQVFLQGVYEDFSAEPLSGFAGPTELVILGNFGRRVNLQNLFETYCIDD